MAPGSAEQEEISAEGGRALGQHALGDYSMALMASELVTCRRDRAHLAQIPSRGSPLKARCLCSPGGFGRRHQWTKGAGPAKSKSGCANGDQKDAVDYGFEMCNKNNAPSALILKLGCPVEPFCPFAFWGFLIKTE